METKNLSAKEAMEKAMSFSDIDSICKSIACNADKGLFKSHFIFLSEIDIRILEDLGYMVHKNMMNRFPFEVSWEPIKVTSDKLREQIGEVFIEWADNYFTPEKYDEQLTDNDLYELFYKQNSQNRRFWNLPKFKISLRVYRDWKTKL